MKISVARRLSALLTGALSLTLATAPLNAEPGGTVQVRTAGLDLTTAAGEKRLKLRLMQAVSETCPIGARCRAPALAKAYAPAAQIVAAARKGGAVPDYVQVSVR